MFTPYQEVTMGRHPRVHRTDPGTIWLIEHLRRISRENDAPVWRDVAYRLSRPRRTWAEVNVGELERFVGPGETVVIPGRLLGSGAVSRPVTVAALGYTRSAREKIERGGGKVMGIHELAGLNPKGSNVRIVR